MIKRIVHPALLAALLTATPAARAHETLGHSVLHGWTIHADAKLVDLEVELIFYSHPAQDERHAMDLDADGKISAAEQNAYTTRMLDDTPEQLCVMIDDHAPTVTALHHPKLNLRGNTGVGEHPFSLTLYFFVRSNDLFGKAGLLSIEDRLFPNTEDVVSTKIFSSKPLRLKRLDDCEVLSHGLDPLFIHLEYEQND